MQVIMQNIIQAIMHFIINIISFIIRFNYAVNYAVHIQFTMTGQFIIHSIMNFMEKFNMHIILHNAGHYIFYINMLFMMQLIVQIISDGIILVNIHYEGIISNILQIIVHVIMRVIIHFVKHDFESPGGEGSKPKIKSMFVILMQPYYPNKCCSDLSLYINTDIASLLPVCPVAE